MLRYYATPRHRLVLHFEVKNRSGYAYLTDGNGRVIYHPDGSAIGRNLRSTPAVQLALRQQFGALLLRSPEGELVVSGFATVSNTDWILVTQERWQNVAGSIRSSNRYI